MALSAHPEWAPTALDALQKSLELLNEKRIKVVINGGALNPKGLAERTVELVRAMIVAYSSQLTNHCNRL